MPDTGTPAEDAGIATFRTKIGGMSCSFCTSTIHKAYDRLPGVEKVGVSLAHEEGLVRYDPEQVTEDDLKQTLLDIGYTVRDPDKVRTYEEEEAELRHERNRLLVAGTLTLTTLVLMVFGMEPFLTWLSHPLLPWVLAAIALETMFVTAWFVKEMAFQSLRRGILNQHNLLEFGAFGGLLGGFLGIFVSPETFPAGHFFAVSTFVTTYHLLSHYASQVVRTRSGQAVRKLLDLQPDTARVVRDGEERDVPTDEVVVGDLVRIRPGESVPVDGEVTEGGSAVDQSLVTGEPIPTEKVAGDEVIGGSINQTGTLLVRVTTVGEESFLSQVVREVEEARSLRPGVLQLVDRILQVYVPGVLGFAALGFLLWSVGPLVWGGSPDLARATFAALAVLVMGYPCALGMATPLAMIRGGGMAAERGILMRSGEAFQVMPQVSTVVLDKTGTITRGEPAVDAVVPARVGGNDELLRLAAAAEASSEHPLARAIEEAAEERGLKIPRVDDFRAHAGRGVEAVVSGDRVLVGKPGFLDEQGTDTGPLAEDTRRLEGKGQTVVAVARSGELLGLLGIADTTKEDAAEAVRRMEDAGLETLMITGDNERTARTVAEQVGMTDVLAQVLPDEKAERVRALQDEGRRVLMVGDGINDAPALTQADMGIAIGAGTDIAIESADIVVMGDRLGAVTDAYEIGENSYRKTKQNLGLAFSFNGVGVPAAVSGLVHPIFAMLAMVLSVTLVLANSFGRRVLDRLADREEGRPEQEEPDEHEHPAPEAPEDGPEARPEPEKPERPAPEPEGARSVRLAVRMHCEGCAGRIEGGLGDLEGVSSVHADHEGGVVETAYDPGTVFEGQIRDRLRELGYRVDGHVPEEHHGQEVSDR